MSNPPINNFPVGFETPDSNRRRGPKEKNHNRSSFEQKGSLNRTWPRHAPPSASRTFPPLPPTPSLPSPSPTHSFPSIPPPSPACGNYSPAFWTAPSRETSAPALPLTSWRVQDTGAHNLGSVGRSHVCAGRQVHSHPGDPLLCLLVGTTVPFRRFLQILSIPSSPETRKRLVSSRPCTSLLFLTIPFILWSLVCVCPRLSQTEPDHTKPSKRGGF